MDNKYPELLIKTLIYLFFFIEKLTIFSKCDGRYINVKQIIGTVHCLVTYDQQEQVTKNEIMNVYKKKEKTKTCNSKLRQE